MNGVVIRLEWRADTGWALSVVGRLERANELRDVIAQIEAVGALLPASAIEARSGETTEIGSTEGESATGEAGDAQND